MLFIKEFNDKRVLISDGENDYTLTADGDQYFIREIIENILDWANEPAVDNKDWC